METPGAISNLKGVPMKRLLQRWGSVFIAFSLVFLLAFERRGKPFAGRTFWLYILLYAISRFIVEIYRGDPRGTVMGLSTSQFVSVVTLPIALVMLARLRKTGAAATA